MSEFTIGDGPAAILWPADMEFSARPIEHPGLTEMFGSWRGRTAKLCFLPPTPAAAFANAWMIRDALIEQVEDSP